jgi:hypothetical protein
MWMGEVLLNNTNAKDCMMYRMEIDTHEPIILNTWIEVERHPLFSIAIVCERTPIGWMAI